MQREESAASRVILPQGSYVRRSTACPEESAMASMEPRKSRETAYTSSRPSCLRKIRGA
ncbi:hypothetical protein Barb6XT_02865 [Bacteroidales bacterium Barb6XT]|nr:hypothetical protein Barb6XT_02865 [Bacteroidales bacterium Barb6XT]